MVEQYALDESTSKHFTAQPLRNRADHDDYMADRVYGKVVETNDEARRIERLHHRAHVLRTLADSQERS